MSFRLSNVYIVGSCYFAWPGCTESTAFNFDETANVDDGSCKPAVQGCIYPSADNYYSEANVDDGSCTFRPIGCTDSTALNYNSLARAPGDGVTDTRVPQDAKAVFSAVNRRRQTHCSGRITWDTYLQSGASAYALTCPEDRSSHAARSGVHGELLYRSENLNNVTAWTVAQLTNTSLGTKQRKRYFSQMSLAGQIVADSWYSGAVHYPFPASGDPPVEGCEVWADFTEMIWRSNMRMGCGMAFQPDCPLTTVVCRFTPGGNYFGGFEDNIDPPGTCDTFPGCIPYVAGCMSQGAASMPRPLDQSLTLPCGAHALAFVPRRRL